jgi:hypothetical protein
VFFRIFLKFFKKIFLLENNIKCEILTFFGVGSAVNENPRRGATLPQGLGGS